MTNIYGIGFMTKIQKLISTQKFPPVIFLYGKEEYLSDEAYRQLRTALVKTEEDKFNLDIFQCNDKEFSASNVAGICNASPMMGERRIVVLNQFDSLYSLKTGKKAELEHDPLVRYIENPLDSTILIIRAGEIDAFKNIEKAISKNAGAIQKKMEKAKLPFNLIFTKGFWCEFPQIYDNQMPSWIANRFRTDGFSCDIQAANLLTSLVDADLRIIANTIEMIEIYLSDSKTVTAEAINFLIGQSKHYNSFELEKAVGTKNLELTLNIVSSMQSASSCETQIVGRLTNYFSILWKLSEEVKKGLVGPKLAGTVGVHPVFLNDYINAQRLYSPAELSNIFLLLTKVDTLLKTTQTNKLYLMQDLIIKIINR